MIDNEIIKALECCSKTLAEGCCKECPMKKLYKETCITTMSKSVLDLINRQQAEIEKLTKDINAANSVIKNTFLLKAGVNNDPFVEIKAEAIKEFAERLKVHTIEIDVSYGYGREHYTKAVTTIAIDNLVKEMAGEGG